MSNTIPSQSAYKGKTEYLKVSRPRPCVPYIGYDYLDLTDDELKQRCPLIRFTQVTDVKQLEEYLIEFFAFNYHIDANLLTRESSLVDDVERHVWAQELDMPFEEVTYGRIGCGKDDDGNVVGGISDRGLVMFMFFQFDLESLFGIRTVKEPRKANLVVNPEEDPGSLLDCETIADLAAFMFAYGERYRQLHHADNDLVGQ
ncbi:hypothetical protein [Vibrio agarivorans]|uniref:Uncharacterized protein n=1 Tax=Vibrio agarivorans TaxID=153622 RepID=A0ABT7Y5U9_9VIBR|nr:hypothetical protein [Vibrio agarivorans]MDN2483430.1 hypothetical protein [Vibrio agarivorans]